MTWQHFLRAMTVAGLGTLALAAIAQARAEGGEGAGVYGAAPSIGAAEPALAEETPVALAPEPESDPVGPGKARRSVATDAKRSAELKPLVVRYASENDLPLALADAVIRVESRYNAKARNGVNVGLTQINAGTARSLGYTGELAGLLDAETNLRYGLKYLAQAYKLAGGDTCGTILRFQAGHRAQTMTRAARSYCSRIQLLMAQAS